MRHRTPLSFGRVRLFNIRNSTVIRSRLREVHHLVSYAGATGATWYYYLRRGSATLVLRVLNLRTQPRCHCSHALFCTEQLYWCPEGMIKQKQLLVVAFTAPIIMAAEFVKGS